MCRYFYSRFESLTLYHVTDRAIKQNFLSFSVILTAAVVLPVAEWPRMLIQVQWLCSLVPRPRGEKKSGEGTRLVALVM